MGDFAPRAGNAGSRSGEDLMAGFDATAIGKFGARLDP